MKRVLGFVLLLLLSPAPARWAAADMPPSEEFAAVRDTVCRAIDERRVPSVAIAVVRDGQLVWAEGFGWAHLDPPRPATANTIYRLASISKAITATGLMRLVEQGRLALDAPANQYLAVPLRAPLGSADAITIRRLANHTAGLPVHYNFYFDNVPPLSMDETIRRYGFAASLPGERWEYSNLAFGVLGHISARVAGTSWREFLERELFDPLRMSRTSDRVRPGLEAEAATQYAVDLALRPYPLAPYDFDHPGASAICSSAHDLARFAQMHLLGGELEGVRILDESSVRQMQELTGRRGDDRGTGVGWTIGRVVGQRMVGHDGGMPGVSTALRLYPDARAATIVLTNSNPGNLVDELSRELAGVLFPPVDAGKKESAPASPTSESEVDPTPWLGTWEGRMEHFTGDLPLELTVRSRSEMTLAVGRSAAHPVADARIDPDSTLRGKLQGYLELQRGFHGNAVVELRLEQRGERLVGTAVATAPGYFALAHWVELKRRSP